MGAVHTDTCVLREHPWLPVVVDRDGRVVFERVEHEWLERRPRPRGRYLSVSIEGKSMRLHRLVAECFLGPQEGKVCRHLNDNPRDNRLSNLTWGTQRENCGDTVRNGRSTRGEKNAQAVLTVFSVREIRAKCALGVPLLPLAKLYGVSIGTICDIKKHRTWKHL